jgi:hypothetical protein
VLGITIKYFEPRHDRIYFILLGISLLLILTSIIARWMSYGLVPTRTKKRRLQPWKALCGISTIWRLGLGIASATLVAWLFTRNVFGTNSNDVRRGVVLSITIAVVVGIQIGTMKARIANAYRKILCKTLDHSLADGPAKQEYNGSKGVLQGDDKDDRDRAVVRILSHLPSA